MRIGVMGAGAIGCYLGARLASGGAAVTLVGRKRLVDAANADGLRAQGLDGKTLHIPATALDITEDAAALSACEAILVTVKSGQTEDAARQLAKVAAADALIISFQNGLRNADTVRRMVGARSVLAGMVPFNVVWEEAALFRQTTSGVLALEKGAGPATTFAACVRAGGLAIDLHSDMQAVQWGKLVLNLNNSLNALSGIPLKQQLSDREYRRCLAAAISEALDLLKRAGIQAHSPLKAPLSLVPRVLRAPTPLFRWVAQAMLRVDPQARSSMWDDLERGRQTEVDYLNGEVVELAKAQGRTAPINEAIVQLIKKAEARPSPGSPQLSAPALRAALGI